MIDRLFRRQHSHVMRLVDEVWIGPTLVGRTLVCSCRFECRALTVAGYQQVGWWQLRGLEVDEGVARVWAGEDALERWDGAVRHLEVS